MRFEKVKAEVDSADQDTALDFIHAMRKDPQFMEGLERQRPEEKALWTTAHERANGSQPVTELQDGWQFKVGPGSGDDAADNG